MRAITHSDKLLTQNDKNKFCLSKNDMATPGERLQQAIDRKKGADVDSVADALGVTKNTVYRWLRNAPVPKYEDMERLAEYLGEPLAYFYTGIRTKVANGEAQSDLFEKPSVLTDDELPAGTMQVFTDKDGAIVGYLALKSEFVWLRRERHSAEALEQAMKVGFAGEVNT